MTTRTLTTTETARLMNTAHTRHEISIVIPSTNNGNIAGLKIRSDAAPVLRASVITAISKLFAKEHGGYSAYDQIGGWIDSDTGELVNEVSTVIKSNVSTLTPASVNQLIDLAQSVRQIFQQDAVMVTIDYAAWFVAADTVFPAIG